MKPGDEVWVPLDNMPAQATLGHGSDAACVVVRTPDMLLHGFRPQWVFPTEKEALEALIKRQTKHYAEQTQQHNDLIARLSRRLEDL